MSAFGYPPSLRGLEFDYSFMVRGIIVDKRRGNVIKVRPSGGVVGGVQRGRRGWWVVQGGG